MKQLVSLILFCTFSTSALAANPDPKGIMEKNELARKVKEIVASAELKTFGGDKKDNAKEFTWQRKLQGDGVRYSTMTRFHSPPTIKGQGILILERPSSENEIMMYIPAYKKVRRVENQEQSGSFMGSVFSYSDMATPQINDYKYKFIKEEKCPVETSATCFVVEQTAESESIKQRQGYTKWVTWLNKESYMVDQREYYDLAGKLVKRLIAKDTKLVDAKEKRYISQFLHIDNVQNGRSSEMKLTDVKVNTGIPDATFTQQFLQRGQ